MNPYQAPYGAYNSPSSTSRGNQRLRPGLSIPLPLRDSSLAVPLPLPPITPHAPIYFSDLERLNYIGSGRGGTVFRVLHRPSNKFYALKVIFATHEDGMRNQIHREIEILRNVDHPNIVKCHEMFEIECRIQVVLEYMDLGSLDGAEVSYEPALANVAKQVLTGLLYLHRNKIVHRDIKPSNLLINSNNEVKIADFGVSRILSKTMDPCNSSVGTIAYMSPERINTDSNDGQYDGYAGDVWSFGVCILEFYLGRFPFDIPKEADWATLVCAICMSPPPTAPASSSREFQDFVNCCLRKNPTKRWSVAKLLQHPFVVLYGDALSPNGGGGNGYHGRYGTSSRV